MWLFSILLATFHSSVSYLTNIFLVVNVVNVVNVGMNACIIFEPKCIRITHVLIFVDIYISEILLIPNNKACI